MSTAPLSPDERVPDRGRTLPWSWVAGLAVLAVSVRALPWARVEVVRRDGIWFLEQARHITNGDWTTALAWYQHPLFAALTAFVARTTGVELELAGRLVAVGCGALAVVPLALATCALFGRTPAIAAGVVYAALPHAVRAHVHPLSEGPFHLFLLTATWAGVITLRANRRALGAFAVGLASGLAYLARPEGLAVAVVAGIALLFARERGSATGATGGGLWSRRRLGPLSALALGLAITVGPYVWHLSSTAGRLCLTAKKDIGVLAGVKDDRYVQRLSDEGLADRPARAAWQVVEHTAKALSYVAAALALIGLFATGRYAPRGHRGGALLLAGVILLYLVVLFRLAYTYSYLDKRHALTPGLLLLPWSGVAITAISAAIGRKRPMATLTILLVAILAASLPSAWKSVDRARVPLKTLGHWVREHHGPDRIIAPLGFPWIPYYAGARPIDILGDHQDVWFANPTEADFNGLGDALRAAKVEFVITSSRQPTALREWLEAHSTVLHRVPEQEHTAGSGTGRGKGDDWWCVRSFRD